MPVILKPNAGLPEIIDGKTQFNVSPEEFAEDVTKLLKKGLRVVGGCCGTTPDYIKALTEKSKDLKPVEIENKNLTVVSSYTKAVKFLNSPILIGERINPTGKKRFKQALIENDISYMIDRAEKITFKNEVVYIWAIIRKVKEARNAN